jgi:hypothetical protein
MNVSPQSNISEDNFMEVQQDFKELLALFNAHKVEYVIVGGYALAFHGAPRYTGNIEILVRPDEHNAKLVLKALAEFGFGSVGLKEKDFVLPDKVVQLGVPPVRVDIMTSLSGISWEEAHSGRVAGKYGDITVHYLGRKQFVANKKATGRRKDLADLEALGEK